MTGTVLLNNGVEMPRLGLGVYKAAPDGEVQTAIADAVSIGYRLIDTASAYGNEEAVGEAVRSLSIPREELFITTKVWNNAQRLGAVEDAFFRSLDRLGTDYVDLYLIHWPVPGMIRDTWRVLEELYQSGKVRAVGVSNFTIRHLDELMSGSSLIPAVDQIEYHPLRDQDELRRFCIRCGITVQAYAPLARGAYFSRPVIEKLAEKYNRSGAQIGLRWLLQKDICVIPKAVRPDHLLNNSQIFDFELDEMDMQAIDSLNENFRCSSIPADLQTSSEEFAL